MFFIHLPLCLFYLSTPPPPNLFFLHVYIAFFSMLFDLPALNTICCLLATTNKAYTSLFFNGTLPLFYSVVCCFISMSSSHLIFPYYSVTLIPTF